MKLKFEKINPEAISPTKAHPNDACWDLYSVDTKKIEPNECKVVNTGLRFEIPPGYVVQVYSRSGLAVKNTICVYNAPSVIDADYTGELAIPLYNGGHEGFWIKQGMKIAQFRLVQLLEYSIEEGIVNTNTSRGNKGFGSSGL